MTSTNPRCVLLFSGKRKSGKDHLTDYLNSKIRDSVIIKLSGPIKKCYSETRDLDFEKLLSSGEYKEQHRLPMIKWSEEIRNKDNGYFCRKAIEMYEGSKYPVWVVSDCRRLSDIKFFIEEFGKSVIQHVRIVADEDIRTSRGFKFQQNVDDAESECGLDQANFDIVIKNNGDAGEDDVLAPVMEWVQSKI